LCKKYYICSAIKRTLIKYKRLKTSVLALVLIAALSFGSVTYATAQADEKEKWEHRFSRLGIEVRADFDYLNNYAGDTIFSNYGFNGKYFNLHLGGEFGSKFSYYFRQRIIANWGTSRLFDNTDFLYLQCNINDNWAVRFGKEAIAVGGFEYDAAPIDVLYYTKYWGNIYCFQLAASASYTDNSGNNKLVLQVANSPYVYFTGAGDEWKKGLLAYSFMWSGNFNHFSALYSVNMFERQRGKFMGQVALGNKLSFDKWSIYLDYFGKAVDTDKILNDFSVVTRLDVKLKDVNIFAKGGYEQNKSEDFWTPVPKDILMTPGQSYIFYGLGVEYRPAFYKNIRLHAYVVNAQTIQDTFDPTAPYPAGETIWANATSKSANINVNVGLSWNVDFLKFIDKKFKKDNN